MEGPFAEERRIAELAIQRAARATEHVRKQHGGNLVTWKGDRSPVSLADYASQVLLVAAIHGAFPEDRIVAEETPDGLREDKELLQLVWGLVSVIAIDDDTGSHRLASPSSVEEALQLLEFSSSEVGDMRTGRVWTIDPIDGTLTYLEGSQYAIVTALLVDGAEQLGVIGCPRLSATDDRATGSDWNAVDASEQGCIVSAVRGHGTQIRPLSTDGRLSPGRTIPIRTGAPDQTRLRYAENSRSVRPLFAERHRIALALGGSWDATQIFSTQLRYVACALGRCDVLTRIPAAQDDNAWVWDHAGGMLIFAEAGGRTTDLAGRDVDCGVGRRLDANTGTLAAPASVHAAVLGATQRVLKEFSDYALDWGSA